MVQYRISSGNDGGFFKIDKNTGFITTASNFKGKKGERFTIKVSAYDNHEKAPTNEAEGEATAQVMVVLVSYDVVFFKLSLLIRFQVPYGSTWYYVQVQVRKRISSSFPRRTQEVQVAFSSTLKPFLQVILREDCFFNMSLFFRYSFFLMSRESLLKLKLIHLSSSRIKRSLSGHYPFLMANSLLETHL